MMKELLGLGILALLTGLILPAIISTDQIPLWGILGAVILIAYGWFQFCNWIFQKPKRTRKKKDGKIK
jgi:hypothetical protein